MARKTKADARKARTPSTEKKTSSGDRLAEYTAKRRFNRTPEPAPRSSQKRPARGKKSPAAPPTAEAPPARSPATRLRFVVQKHDARRLHYDVRLEIDGAMASWAVPKGPSYDPAVRRLAVQTEDHPIEYNDFEGRIPDGEYGAGDVLIWDRGTYETVPPGQQRAMLDKGHLHVRLFGDKLTGEWHLVRTRRGGGDDGAGRSGKAQWLLFKAKDASANAGYDVIAARPESIVSGRLATRGPRRAGASAEGKSAKALLEAVGRPALATAVTGISDPARWLFEMKYDGYRILAAKAGSEVRLATRRANDWTERFPPIRDAVACLPARECVLDGEACVVDEKGRPSFGALQEYLAGRSKGARIAYAVFDLLWLDGRDRRADPIEARRELLEHLLEGQQGALTLSRSVEGSVPDLLTMARKAGVEGLVAKKKGSAYISGRSGAWVKLRFDRRQDCAIAGYIPLAGTHDVVGALLLAINDGRTLTFAGRVGTGFDTATRRDLARRLDRARIDRPSIEGAPVVKNAHWVEVSLVCECGFAEWTRDGSMRHPRFLTIREDKTPMECVREGQTVQDDAPAVEGEAPDVEDGAPDVGAPIVHATVSRVDDASASRPPQRRSEAPKLVNAAKVIFPRDGLTKGDVWDYYTAVAPVMLPHLLGRPLTLQRYPNGIEGEEWYQQNAPEKIPGFVRLVDVGPRHDGKKRIVCDNLETLQWLANLAALTIHQWCSHVPPDAVGRAAIDRAIAQPDYVVLDLDPGAGPWWHLVEVARAVHKLLEALHLESVVKTSGKRGVHVLIPIAPGATHAQATGFAEQVARAVSKVLPDLATVERMKDKRRGKLYVDYGQNGEGRTIVAPYTIRARDGAVVSTPIEWSELDETLDPTRFTIRTVLSRIEKRGDLFAAALGATQTLPRV
ncbi:MAG TPA: DNA ligase D [Polyangiaceae bacterium]|nr:DNA ligase D [Polyangiaceae bacterium]